MTQQTFKAGDMVVCIDNQNAEDLLEKGGVYKIKRIIEHSSCVIVEDVGFVFNPQRFKLAEEPAFSAKEILENPQVKKLLSTTDYDQTFTKLELYFLRSVLGSLSFEDIKKLLEENKNLFPEKDVELRKVFDAGLLCRVHAQLLNNTMNLAKEVEEEIQKTKKKKQYFALMKSKTSGLTVTTSVYINKENLENAVDSYIDRGYYLVKTFEEEV